ncbi:hypothetical protein FACS189490_00320 [Clostridia bacterium]|nr:hypothetical protein FACS189490_00320 [Clostridia bacterium]
MEFINIDDLSGVLADHTEAEQLITAVGGIKFDEGSRRFANKRDKYITALYKFSKSLESYENKSFEDFISDSDAAKTDVHTIKGTAGNLSIYSVHYAARDFETTLKEGAPDAALFAEYMKTVVTVRDHLLSVLRKGGAVAVTEKAAGYAEAVALLRELKEALLLSEATKCDEIANKLKSTDFEGIKKSSLEVIFGCVEDYDYDLAIDLIDNMVER